MKGRAEGYTWDVIGCAPHEVAEEVRREAAAQRAAIAAERELSERRLQESMRVAQDLIRIRAIRRRVRGVHGA